MERTSSVFARPGAPVIRQCPPAKRLIRSCSMTSAWPTITFDNSAPSLRRLPRICSTVCCSRIKGSVVSSATLVTPLMRHRVRHDVDAKRIRPFLGEFFEVLVIRSFLLPAVPQVGIVANDRHHSPLVVQDPAIVRFGGVPPTVVGP